MISLHIKGDMVAALRAARKHRVNITAIQVRYRSGIAECFAATSLNRLPEVQAWYADDGEIIDGYGFPAGTLLLFTRDEHDAA
jgi:hypothetical protein